MTPTSDHNPFSSLERFDGAAAWATLTLEQQAEIGAIALELVVAIDGHEACVDVDRAALFSRIFDAGADLLVEKLHDAAVTALEADILVQLLIPSLLGPVCRVCGCSEHDACDGGCSWAEPDLCTACVTGAPGEKPS